MDILRNPADCSRAVRISGGVLLPREAVWAISLATVALIVARPWRVGEWVWSVAGAAVLVASGLLPQARAEAAVRDGLDVYLFLAGMLALAEQARVHGVFDCAASAALRIAGGSAHRLLLLVYGLGVVVTALLSNDGTVLLLTPAMLAAARQQLKQPAPLLFACALVANAAGFLLPISNPANLVVFGNRLPVLAAWLHVFGIPSMAAIVLTYAGIAWYWRRDLRGALTPVDRTAPLSRAGGVSLAALVVSTALLVFAAATGRPIGATAFVLGLLCSAIVTTVERGTLQKMLRGAPWSIIPLVAGLFVIVQALDRSGILEAARFFFRWCSGLPIAGRLISGIAVTLAGNVFNNLPIGLLARYTIHGPGVDPAIAHAALVGVDLGPNLSVTGSLATLIWIFMLRRAGIELGFWQFLRAGIVVLPLALLLALLLVR